MPGWVLKAEQVPFPLNAWSKRKVRNSSRPAAQAPHAPPAL